MSFVSTKSFQNMWQAYSVQTVMGVFMLYVCSQIVIPLQPIPITLQTFGVMLVALTLPRKAALHSIISYVMLGVAGLPILAGGTGGLGKIFGPAGGYYIGFIMAVYVMVHVRPVFEKLFSRPYAPLFLTCLLGSICIYIPGVAWLSYYLGSFTKGMTFGLMPFILPGIVKAVLLTGAIGVIQGKKG